MIKTILKRVGFLFLVIVMGVTGFCVGYGVVFAHIIPGWDRPFDPPNYYDPDRISWADTNNPSFSSEISGGREGRSTTTRGISSPPMRKRIFWAG